MSGSIHFLMSSMGCPLEPWTGLNMFTVHGQANKMFFFMLMDIWHDSCPQLWPLDDQEQIFLTMHPTCPLKLKFRTKIPYFPLNKPFAKPLKTALKLNIRTNVLPVVLGRTKANCLQMPTVCPLWGLPPWVAAQG